jgi:hypothetical protein
MARKSTSSGKGKCRSAISGRYVTAKHGKSSPKTTVRESTGRMMEVLAERETLGKQV